MAREDDRPSVRRVLTIAGSDSGGGAGVQADLKAFARCGVHGMTAITAVTAQNTRGVAATHAMPAAMVVAQIRAVIDDIGVDAIKIGMLGMAQTVVAVADCLQERAAGVPIVIDPVMSATTRAALLDDEGRAALIRLLLPLATVLTPNRDEARVIVGDASGELDDEALVRSVVALGPRIVVLTGSARGEVVVDLFFDGSQVTELTVETRPSDASHGSGCTHSAVLAAQLALGREPLEAARTAQRLTATAIEHGLQALGEGAGPVDITAGP